MSESITHNDRKAAALLRIIPFLCLGIFFLLSFSCSHKDSDRIVCEITEPLDSLLGTVFSAPDAPGAFVTVMRGDSVVYAHGFGLARLDTRAPMTDTTRFNICSASKLFVTAGVMKLVEQHRLGLDDTLSEFFPQLDKNVFGKITIRHILT
ncbi:MAG: beta-lactamase family protein, partial [Muribaculaceae bacterium]|nr:beta-lactamase family protein [Muribaculaceae bacterium]